MLDIDAAVAQLNKTTSVAVAGRNALAKYLQREGPRPDPASLSETGKLLLMFIDNTVYIPEEGTDG
jgi:hypothetical protein